MITIAAAQFLPGESRANNLQEIDRLTKLAVAQNADIVVFPEYSAWFAGALSEKIFQNAETSDGPFLTGLKRIALRHKTTIVAGILEHVPDSNPRPYNTVSVIDANGEMEFMYRKVHLYDAFGSEESRWVRPGPIDQQPVFTHSGLTIGIQTCYDLRFPEGFRRGQLSGVDVMILPAQWVPGPDKELHWMTLLKARAIENTAYVVAADQGPPAGVGLTSVIDPRGRVISTVEASTGLAILSVSTDEIATIRTKNPSLAMRRYPSAAQIT